MTTSGEESGAPPSLIQAGDDEVLLLPESETPEGPDDSAEPDIVRLWSGSELSISEAAFIARAGNTRVIVLAGEHNAGKTTFVSGVYHGFLDGPYEDLWFKHSRTLYAFEERVFRARVASGLTQPAMQRTEGTHVRFFHLELGELDGESMDFLISDISGEAFEQLRKSAELVSEFDVFRSADHFLYLVNGKGLGSPAERATVKMNVVNGFRRLVEGDLLPRNGQIVILFNKSDEIETAGVQANEAVENLKEALKQILEDYPNVVFQKINSLSMLDKEKRDPAFTKLVRSWYDAPVGRSPFVDAVAAIPHHSIDEFGLGDAS